MTEWPLVLKKPGASDVVCFNATAEAISASSRTAIRFPGNDLHRPPWSRLDLPVWLDLLNPGREARFRRPSTDTPRLEVRFARGGIEEERIYDLIDLQPVPPGLPGLPAGFQLCPRSSDGPRTLPVVALRRRGGDNGLLNDTADVFCINTTAEPFVVSAFKSVKANTTPIVADVLPGGALKLCTIEPGKSSESSALTLGVLYQPATPGALSEGEFSLDLRMFPFEEIEIPGVGPGSLLLPWSGPHRAPSGGTYEVVPGESIGPIRLGMTRREVESLGLGPRIGSEDTLHFPVPSPGEPCSWHNAGLTARFEKGVCRLIGARLRTLGALFTLEGRVLDGMSEGAFVTLIESLGAEAQLTLGSVQAPGLGLRAGKWEFSDSYFSDVEVMAPTGSERTLPQETTSRGRRPRKASRSS